MISFSVVTIVRNDAPGVIRTLQSVLAQTYENFEIIVQDGASTDYTSDVLRSFGNQIDSLTIEPDNGIYDAMNRALRRARGEYCIFMNAADFFVDNKVLARAAERIDPTVDDIWAGKALSDEHGTVHNYREPDRFWAGSTFDHQAAFIRTSLMQQLEYDISYEIAGDLHFFTRARQHGAQFTYDDMIIARKPFAVGASSDFISRLKDRLDMLETAWADQYPVRDLITRELRMNLAQSFDLNPNRIAEMSLEELLVERERWTDRL